MRMNSNYNEDNFRKQTAITNDETESLLPTIGESTESSFNSGATATAAASAAAVTTTHRTFFRKLSSHVFPARWDIIEVARGGGAADMDMNVAWNSMDDPLYNNRQQQRKIISSRFKQSKETTKVVYRSWTRRIYLLLTEPDTYVETRVS
jgi:hypothetical protein